PVPRDEKGLLDKIREIAHRHPSYGYRRVHYRLVRSGVVINLKKLRRLYRQEKLILRRKRKPRRIVGQGHELPLRSAKAPYEVWSMDFLYDQLSNGRRIRVLTILDHFSRMSPGVFVRRSFQAEDLCKIFDHLFQFEPK